MRQRIITMIVAVALMAIGAQAQLLWKVSGNGLPRPSYIFGTHHLASASMLDSIAGMQEAIEGCDVVLGEIEKDSLMSPDAQARIAQAMMAPPDSTLDRLLTPTQYATVERVFNKYFATMHVKLSQMNALKPNAISTQMQAMQALKYFNDFDASSQIDLAVQTRANDEGKPSAGLETVSEQIDLLYNGPLTEQAEGLVETCKNDESFQLQMAALSEAYMTQDLDKLQAVMTDATVGGSEAENERLIYSRNRRWVEKLVQLLPERAALVCVGAGHLPGEQGLLQLLRDRGYRVEPMK